MNRNVALALGIAFVFAATVFVLSRLMPAPHKPTDYLVMGAAATVLCMVLLFVVLIVVPGRQADAGKEKKP